jgi:hypothetical protein
MNEEAMTRVGSQRGGGIKCNKHFVILKMEEKHNKMEEKHNNNGRETIKMEDKQ